MYVHQSRLWIGPGSVLLQALGGTPLSSSPLLPSALSSPFNLILSFQTNPKYRYSEISTLNAGCRWSICRRLIPQKLCHIDSWTSKRKVSEQSPWFTWRKTDEGEDHERTAGKTPPANAQKEVIKTQRLVSKGFDNLQINQPASREERLLAPTD